MKTINPVVWFEIYVDDLKRAQQFYEKVLDVKLKNLSMPDTDVDEMEMYAFPMEMDGEGAAGALVKMKGMKAGGNSTIVYFGSKNCAIEETLIKAAGGQILQSKQSIREYGFTVLGTDSEGNTFGVHSEV